MKTINDISLNDTIPSSIGSDKNVLASIAAIDPKLREVSFRVDTPSIYANLDTLSSLALDHLAIQYDVDAWRDSWPVELKRSVIKNVIYNKRKVGTLYAVKQAVESLGGSVSIVEWWQEDPKGIPHTFRIKVTLQNLQGTLNSEMQEDLHLMIQDAKPSRSQYTLELGVSVDGKLGVFGCVRSLAVGSVRSRDIIQENYQGGVGIFAASRLITSRHLIAEGE